MTDAELAAWEVEAAESCGLGTDDSLALIAEVRRLRELERAVRAIMHYVGFGSERHWYLAEGITRAQRNTIGRLLDGAK